MSHKMLRPFIVKVTVLGYFPLLRFYRNYIISTFYIKVFYSYLRSQISVVKVLSCRYTLGIH